MVRVREVAGPAGGVIVLGVFCVGATCWRLGVMVRVRRGSSGFTEP